MINKIKLNKNFIGDGYPCYFTLEIGPTHNGFESAKNLITKCSNSGANAVKLQLIDPEQLIADKKYSIDYKILSKRSGKLINKQKSVFKIFKKRFLNYDEIKELKKIANMCNLDFFLTITNEDDIDFIKELNCPSVKIASSDVNYHQLIAKASKLKIPIQLDTGNSTIHEIQEAIKIIKGKKNNNILIHYCPTGYPAIGSLNLNYINFLKNKFKLPIGFSDHSVESKTCHLAILFGANLIEKTVSQNIYTNKIEHSMSTDVKNINSYIHSLKETENQVHKKIIFLTKKEVNKRKKHRRSAYLKKKLHKGEILNLEHVAFKRPGLGIQPNQINKYLGKKSKFNLAINSMIKPNYLK